MAARADAHTQLSRHAHFSSADMHTGLRRHAHSASHTHKTAPGGTALHTASTIWMVTSGG